MTHELAGIGPATGHRIHDWMFICSCGETFTHERRAGAKTAFSVHAHTENRRA